jgi:hypothetical protein
MPIINPMYLYLIEVLHNLDVVNNIVFITLAFITLVTGVMYIIDDYAREQLEPYKGKMIALFIAFAVSALITALIPTKDTMYKMLIASYVTTDNIQIVNDAIKTNLQDYLNMLGEAVKNMK